MGETTRGAGETAPDPRRDDPEAPWSLFADGAGEWQGTETMPPAPWAPDGLETTGRISAHTIMDGRGLASDYVQETDGEVTLRTHTVLRYDEEHDRFMMHFFGGPAGEPTVLEGRREGDRLVFEGQGPAGAMRQTFHYAADEMRVRSESPAGEGEGWTTVFEGRYRPLPDATAVTAAGSVGWQDLTVDDAPALRDFYAAVVGWTPHEISMGEYADYEMHDAGGAPVAGVCHARGVNADLPAAWLTYVRVPDLVAALDAVVERDGEVVAPVREVGDGRMAVIRDPAGAVLALYQG
ncbi:MAG: VOC family protein [Longimicrobiales bacterium]|nr:VOC family protein [Longimicrobiales bacterium]